MILNILFGGLLVLTVISILRWSYNHRIFDVSPNLRRSDFVVQIDDFGQFWDTSAATIALKKIEELAETSSVIVLVFIHGWHHGARPDDKNLRDFLSSVDDTRELLTGSGPESGVYRQSRKTLTGSESLSVVSIYVGWRGRSLPWIFDYATFWGRKAAAERVGEGDLREFLGRLNALYRRRRNLRAVQATRNFFGLIAFGHSFGGQVLFRSIAFELESELLNRTMRDRGFTNKPEQISDLLGFGDLVVLVNPAFEALQFERIWRLSSELEFGRWQNPVMLVISSAGDIPRQVLFPMGRNLDAFFFRPAFRQGQRALWTQALGEYRRFRTHKVEITNDLSPLTPNFYPGIYSADPHAILDLDLTNLPSIGGVKLIPTEHHRNNSPFLIAHADVGVVLNHSDVFERTLRTFLNDYIAISQGKRMLSAEALRAHT